MIGTKKEKNLNNFVLNFALIIILIYLLFYILFIGQKIIIPFILSILFSFAILGLKNFYKKFRIPGFLALILSVLSYFLIFWLIGLIISSNITELIRLSPSYQTRITEIFTKIIEFFGLTVNISDLFSNFDFFKGNYLRQFFASIYSVVTSISGNIGIIFFYTIFILLESKHLNTKLDLMTTDKEKKDKINDILGKIVTDVKQYFVIKTFVSFLTAIISYFIMLIFGLDFAAFWALLIFILNFIPNIGSIIAVLLPSILSFAQAGFGIYSSIFMIVLLISVQVTIGNFIEPKLIGNKLNLSPLVIIISLSFWGYLWGIIGMLLSVPLIVIINIILSKFEYTKPIAILLSEKGNLQIKNDNREEIIKEIKTKFSKK